MGATEPRSHGEEEPTEPEEEKWIDRSELYRKLANAAMVRSIITLFSFVLFLLVWILVMVKFPAAAEHTWPIFVILSAPLLFSLLVTVTLCRKMVSCPHCGNSLWGCGTGNFKPRRMRVRNDIQCCPHCKARIG